MKCMNRSEGNESHFYKTLKEKEKRGRKRSANWLRPKLLIKMVMRKKPIKEHECVSGSKESPRKHEAEVLAQAKEMQAF